MCSFSSSCVDLCVLLPSHLLHFLDVPPLHRSVSFNINGDDKSINLSQFRIPLALYKLLLVCCSVGSVCDELYTCLFAASGKNVALSNEQSPVSMRFPIRFI